jgi:7-cyano-7-deazaguanine reductase
VTLDDDGISRLKPHPFLDSSIQDPDVPRFEALGTTGSNVYAGLETFPNPGCILVTYASDELMCKCPITGQPDFYNIAIKLNETDRCIESKSLKLFFQNIMVISMTSEFGAFCESLAIYIRDQVRDALGCDVEQVSVRLTQKSRGGISIEAIA